jgi:hypothetical protein
MPTKSGESLQIIGFGGMLLMEPHFSNPNNRHKTSLSLAGVVSLLNDSIGLAIGVDLYRAIPIRSADGSTRYNHAETGLLGWALSPTGEFTPENVMFLVTLNASSVLGSLFKDGGEGK